MSASDNDSQKLLIETVATQATTIQVQAQTIDRLQQMLLESTDSEGLDSSSSRTFLDGSPRR
ncbi:hypothetical protein [Pantoea sp. 18069]|uniref:hypothetical protein n=1 Tax=Pantoea sp. 18069 TaxID=2681415 RepID=UPI00135B598D|nr:hypothetical protein [Pantoea sp. 18069]